MPIPHSISGFRERPWFALVAVAVFHLLFTLAVFSVGRSGLAPKHFHPDGIGEFGRDSKFHIITVNRLADTLKQGDIRAWLGSSEQFHLKIYSLSMLPAEFLFGSNILAVEPVNLLYYVAIVTLTFVLGNLVAGPRAAWLAALIVALWPSLLLHTTQFLRDPLVIAVFLGLITVLVLTVKKKLNWRSATGAAIAGVGSFYVLIRVRPGIFLVITAVTLLAAVLLLIKMACLRKLWALNFLVIAVVSVVAIKMPKSAAGSDTVPGIRRPRAVRPAGSPLFVIWNPIAAARYNFITDGRNVSGSMIDADVFFNSGTDVIRYVPRALEIGYLAPFPSMWFQPGQNVGLAGRLLSGTEMMLTYVLEVFACVFIWRRRRDFISWLLVLTTTIGMLAIGFVLANMGTLYRMRYPFWVLLVVMGAASLAGLRSVKASASSGVEPEFQTTRGEV